MADAMGRYSQLCRKYRELCKQKGVKSSQVAQETGIPVSFLKKLDRSTPVKVLTLQHLDSLCKYFHTDLFRSMG